MSIYAKKWIGGLILLLLVLAITPCLISWRMKCVATSMQMKMPLTGVSIYQELQLTKAQKEKIQGLDQEYQKQMTTFCERHCAARMKVSKLLQSPHVDKQSLEAAQFETLDAYSASEKATLQHVLQVSEVLTPDQKNIFLKKFGDQIQVTCPFQFVR
jgi:Spy/CpxP family protein refolding chaperone